MSNSTNSTDNNWQYLCTLQTCPLSDAQIGYVPSLAGNAFYVAIFALLLFAQIFLGIFYRTWGFLVATFMGIVLEVIGYIARIQMHFNPFLQNPFLMYLICLTIGPAFLSAAIYLCLARIVVAYGEHISRVKPKIYTITFMSFDFLSLLLQAIGGAIASTSNTNSSQQTGINIMIAGLSFQVVSLLVFISLCAEFGWRVLHRQNEWDRTHEDVWSASRFRLFLHTLSLATICILIRSIFRVAELSGGFNGTLANQQVTFMILEGAMIIIACTCMTLVHPGFAFQGLWAATNFKLGKGKRQQMGQVETTTPETFESVQVRQEVPKVS